MNKKIFCIVFAFIFILPCLALLGGCNNDSYDNEVNKYKLTFELENWSYIDDSVKDSLYFKFTEKFAKKNNLPKKMNFNELETWVNEGGKFEFEIDTRINFYLFSSKQGLDMQDGICKINEPNKLSCNLYSSYYTAPYESGYYLSYIHTMDTVLTINLKKVKN